jgi:hypothetical protein
MFLGLILRDHNRGASFAQGPFFTHRVFGCQDERDATITSTFDNFRVIIRLPTSRMVARYAALGSGLWTDIKRPRNVALNSAWHVFSPTVQGVYETLGDATSAITIMVMMTTLFC